VGKSSADFVGEPTREGTQIDFRRRLPAS
jgi:hypothetical protein